MKSARVGRRVRCDSARALAFSLALASLACRTVPPRAIDAGDAAGALMARTLTEPQLAEFASTVMGAPLPAPGAAWDERALATSALYFQPRIALAAAEARRARAAIDSAGALPNPTLSIVPQYSLNPAAGETAWAPGFQIDWAIQTAGKRGDLIDQATANALAAHYALAAEVVAVEREVRSARLELASAQEARASLQAELEALRALAQAWRARVELGAASQAVAAPAEAAAFAAHSELAAARAREAAAGAALAAAIGVPLAGLGGIELAPLNANAALAPEATRTRRALAERADVLGALASYAASEAALQLEVAKQFPDLRIGPGYQWDQGQSKWQLGISLDLPILNRNAGPIEEAIAAREAAAAQFNAVQSRALAEIEGAQSALRAESDARDALRESAEVIELQAERADAALNAGAANQLDVFAARALALRARRDARAAELRALGAATALAAARQSAPSGLERLEQLAGHQENR